LRGLLGGLLRRLLRGLLGSLLRSLLRGLLRDPLRRLLGSQASGLLRGLLGSLLGSFLFGGLLRGHLRLAGGFGGMRYFGKAVRLGQPFGIGLFVDTAAFGFDGILNALTGLLPGLRARSRKIAVLGAVEVGP
jgi:hypothetical protein